MSPPATTDRSAQDERGVKGCSFDRRRRKETLILRPLALDPRRTEDMRHFVMVAATFVVSASAGLSGCVAETDDPEAAAPMDEAARVDGDCAGSATPPAYTAPTYGAPTYTGPTYGAPRYSPPVYEAPSYAAPWYQAPSELPAYSGCATPCGGAPSYAAPTYEAPLYLPPITINIYLTLPLPQEGPPPSGGCLPAAQHYGP
jgi:hypothetical protein